MTSLLIHITRGVRAGARRLGQPALSAGGLGCIVAAAWTGFGLAVGLAVLGAALLALEWRLEK